MTFETLGRSTGRPLMLKNCKSRAVAWGDEGACEINPHNLHRFSPSFFVDDDGDDDDDDDDDNDRDDAERTAGDKSISILARPDRNFVPSIDDVRDSKVLLDTLVSISSLVLRPFFDLPTPPPPPPITSSSWDDPDWTSMRLNCVPRHMIASIFIVGRTVIGETGLIYMGSICTRNEPILMLKENNT